MAIRKITSLFFLLPGLAPLLFVFYLSVQKQMIRQRMEQKMETHLLQTIVLAEKDVHWMDDHEIWVNEHMFDIRTRKLENGVYTFTGMYDIEETKLVKMQRKTTDQQQEENQLMIRLFKCLHHTYYDPGHSQFNSKGPLVEFINTVSSLTHRYPEIITPPPRKVC